MTPLLEKRFVVVAGKGGVGKTTVSLLLGRLAAESGRRTLVCLTNAPQRYSALLGGITLDYQYRKVSRNLTVMNLNPADARKEYGRRILKNATLHRFVFGSRIINRFLDALPGLAEWAMLGKATFHAVEEMQGEGGFDLVVFDSPATGHGLDILSLPRAIVSSIPAGRIRQEAMARVELMADPSRFEVLPVTIPEEMPVNELIELVLALEKLNMPAKRLLVNMVGDTPPSEALKKIVADQISKGQLPQELVPAAVAVSRYNVQETCLQRLKSTVGLPLIQLPCIDGAGPDETSLPSLGALLRGQI